MQCGDILIRKPAPLANMGMVPQTDPDVIGNRHISDKCEQSVIRDDLAGRARYADPFS